MSNPPVHPSNPNQPEPGGHFGQAPQYGQPPQYSQAPQYAQPLYGQAQRPGQAPYAAFGQAQYMAYPSELPQRGAAGSAPGMVNISFWLLIGACALWVASVLMSISVIDDPALRRQFEARLAAGGSKVNFDSLKGIIVAMVFAMTAVGAGLYLLVAFKIRKGRNWARILGTILAAFSLLGVLQMNLGTPAILAGAAAMVLLYLPAAAPYFRARQAYSSPYLR